MGLVERVKKKVRSRVAKAAPTVVRRRTSQHPEAGSDEGVLRARLLADPNDRVAFAELAEIVRAHAAEGHEGESRPRAVADAEWALAEELAHNSRAWYPLIELARLSVDDDLEGAQRRLGIAVEREPTGRALTEALAMLRRANRLDAALALGVGHWRPREHVPEAGRELVQIAVQAGRIGEAKRHLAALEAHPDQGAVDDLRIDLDSMIVSRDS
ncbi:MAG TPA: hypothetical protein VF661_00630 [Actinomycetales bacterium]